MSAAELEVSGRVEIERSPSWPVFLPVWRLCNIMERTSHCPLGRRKQPNQGSTKQLMRQLLLMPSGDPTRVQEKGRNQVCLGGWGGAAVSLCT